MIVTPTSAVNLSQLVGTNLTGHPAVIVPNGFREDGTPVSLTFLADFLSEAKALAVARAYQDATGFHRSIRGAAHSPSAAPHLNEQAVRSPRTGSARGRFVRLEPMTLQHLGACPDVGLDPDIWRLPGARSNAGDMRSYRETALKLQGEGTTLPS